MTLINWATRWQMPQQALDELALLLQAPPIREPVSGMSEGAVDQRIELSTPHLSCRLWRNNVGVAYDDRGVPVRFGLANDSAKINKITKSSDRIGVFSVLIGPQHMGKTLGVFAAVEVKHGAWTWKGTDRETAQYNYINLVRSFGGVGIFASAPEHLAQAIQDIRAGV